MFLRKFNCNFLLDITNIALKCGKKRTSTIDNNETKLLVVFQEVVEDARVEPVLATVVEVLDLTEGNDIECPLLFGLVVVHQDHAAEDDKSVLWGGLVQFQLLSG